MTLPYDLGPGGAAFLTLALFLSAIVRGYSGFGFSALVIVSASLVTSPLKVVATVMICEFLMTFQQLRGIWTSIHWRRVRWLMLGAMPGVAIGLWALTGVGVDTVRLIMAVYVLAMCAALWAGMRFSRPSGNAAHGVTGLVSGIANATSVGGLPVAVFFSAQPISAAAFRATLIAYFAFLDLWTAPLMGWYGLVSRDTFVGAVLALPVILLGNWLGARHFLAANPQDFRRFVILLLAGLSFAAIARTLAFG